MEFIDESTGIRLERRGGLATIVLDRPRALNALTHTMVRGIASALTAWEHDPTVHTVLLTGAGERGFCAGGDVVAIHADAVSGGSGALDFWRDEYTLNARIARYTKPIVALMRGLTLGGGVGLAGHARHRVVTGDSAVGMPETIIGFVPDVGGTWLLSHAPGEVGTFLALTGTPTDAAGAIFSGLADVFVPSDRLEALVAELAEDDGEPSAVIARFTADPGPSALAADRSWIDRCFAADRVEDILATLRSEGRVGVAETIEARSPTALAVSLAAVRSARTLPNLEAALVQEFRVASRFLRVPDLAEGIRAQLIDKDRAPRWNPATLADIDAEFVDTFFAPLPDDLRLPHTQHLAGVATDPE
jgi:enoyl-CoA hydratase